MPEHFAAASSPTDTEPEEFSTWTSWPNAPHGSDFARLIPTSSSAKLAFRRVVRRIVREPTFPSHSKRFVYFEYTPAAAIDISSSETDATPAPDTPSQQAAEGLPFVTGFYRLNMLDPAPRPIGWVMGRDPGKKDLAVDFVLGEKRDGLHGYHGRFTRNLDTGALLAVSDRYQVIVDGVSLRKDKATADQTPNEYQLAIGKRATLTLGNLTFILEFQELSPEIDKQQILAARERKGVTKPQPDFFLSPSPSADTERWKDYDIHPPFARGSYGSVAYAMNRVTGAVCAIKKIIFSSNSLCDVQNEIRMLQKYQHTNFCRLIDHSFDTFSHSDLPESSIQTVHLVLEPALKQSLVAFMTDIWQVNVRPEDSLTLNAGRMRLTHEALSQMSSACEHLHAKCVMHRDLKMDNIGVEGINEPFKFYLLDMGHAIEAQSSDDHFKGTIRYLAPEILALKKARNKAGLSYGPRADVWALGLVGAELITKKTIRTESNALELGNTILKSKDQAPVYRALRAMLQTRATDRCSMADVVDILRSPA